MNRQGLRIFGHPNRRMINMPPRTYFGQKPRCCLIACLHTRSFRFKYEVRPRHPPVRVASPELHHLGQPRKHTTGVRTGPSGRPRRNATRRTETGLGSRRQRKWCPTSLNRSESRIRDARSSLAVRSRAPRHEPEDYIFVMFNPPSALAGSIAPMPRAKAPKGWQLRPAIVIDTREPEHTAYSFAHLGAREVRTKLDEGDYSLEGYESLVIVERKELHDAYACIGRERERFERCLERMAEVARKPNGYACVIVEATLQEVAAGIDRSLVSGKAAIGSCLAWSIRHGIPFIFASDRRHAIATVARLLAAWYDYRIAPGLAASDILEDEQL